MPYENVRFFTVLKNAFRQARTGYENPFEIKVKVAV